MSETRIAIKSPYMVLEEVASQTKTLQWVLRNKKHGDLLGVIMWYSPWRRYVLDVDGVVFDMDCLQAIREVLHTVNALQKAMKI